MIYSVHKDRPVSPGHVDAMEAISQAANDRHIPFLLAGAMARDVLLWHVHGHRSQRETLDLDFAFTVESWDQFHELRGHLANRADFKEVAKKPHRLEFSKDGIPVTIDLLPFGSRVESREGVVPWLPGATVEMNMIGFADALRTAVRVAITDDVEIAVASLPMIAALKLFAWQDRQKIDSSKDAEDFAELLVTYEQAGTTDRLVGDYYYVLDAAEHDMTLAGAHLLGHDLAHSASDAIIELLLKLLSEEGTRRHLCDRMMRSRSVTGRQYIYVESLLLNFLDALKSA